MRVEDPSLISSEFNPNSQPTPYPLWVVRHNLALTYLIGNKLLQDLAARYPNDPWLQANARLQELIVDGITGYGSTPLSEVVTGYNKQNPSSSFSPILKLEFPNLGPKEESGDIRLPLAHITDALKDKGLQRAGLETYTAKPLTLTANQTKELTLMVAERMWRKSDFGTLENWLRAETTVTKALSGNAYFVPNRLVQPDTLI